EHNPEWVIKERVQFAEFPDVHILPYEVQADLDVSELENMRFDCAFVDGPVGYLYFKHHERLCSLDYSRHRPDLTFAHEVDRPKAQRSLEYMEDKGWGILERCEISERGFVLLGKIPGWSPKQG